MVFPTLLFSIGAGIFPGLVMGSCLGLIITTGLLALATFGVSLYIIVYFFVALLLAGLRFTPAGGRTLAEQIQTVAQSIPINVFRKIAFGLVTPASVHKLDTNGIPISSADFANVIVFRLISMRRTGDDAPAGVNLNPASNRATKK